MFTSFFDPCPVSHFQIFVWFFNFPGEFTVALLFLFHLSLACDIWPFKGCTVMHRRVCKMGNLIQINTNVYKLWNGKSDWNKTIKDGDIAPWKDFKKEKRKRNQIRPYFEMGRIVKRLHFLRRPSRLRRSSRVYEAYMANDMKDAFPVFWIIHNSSQTISWYQDHLNWIWLLCKKS